MPQDQDLAYPAKRRHFIRYDLLATAGGSEKVPRRPFALILKTDFTQ